jgi:hypothetical protein
MEINTSHFETSGGGKILKNGQIHMEAKHNIGSELFSAAV